MANMNCITSSPSTSFVSRRINDSTFLIVEDDSYGEQPYIYIKIYQNHIVITDTGCNSPRQHDLTQTSLKQYIETYPLPTNNDKPLNSHGKKQYIIICTHCHYDHILGIPQFLFLNPTIIASSHKKSFLLNEFPKHSLCKYIHVPTPTYTITHWADHLSYLFLPSPSSSSSSSTSPSSSANNYPFRIQLLHIPGHTPDSLAWYDIDTHYLFVGDTFYTRTHEPPIPELPDEAGQVPGLPATQAAIIFPEEGGDWIAYMSSLDLLLSFTKYQNEVLRRQHNSLQSPTPINDPTNTEIDTANSAPRVKIACGHLTYGADAEDMIIEVQALFKRIIKGDVPVRGTGMKRGVAHDFWLEGEKARYSVMAPRHLAEEARKYFGKREGRR